MSGPITPEVQVRKVQTANITPVKTEQTHSLRARLVSWVLHMEEKGPCSAIAAWALIAIPLAVASISVFFTHQVLLFIDDYYDQKKEMQQQKVEKKYQVLLTKKDEEIAGLGAAFGEAADRVGHLEGVNDDLRTSQLKTAGYTTTQLTTLRSELRSEIEAKKTALQDLEGARRERAQLASRFAEADKAARGLSQQMQMLSAQSRTLETLISRAMGQGDQSGVPVATQVQQLLAQVEQARAETAQYAQLNAAYNALTEQHGALSEAHNTLSQQHGVLRSEHEEMSARTAFIAERASQYEQDVRSQRTSLQKLNAVLESTEQAKQTLEELHGKLEDQLQQKNNEIGQITAECERQITEVDGREKLAMDLVRQQAAAHKEKDEEITQLKAAIKATENLKESFRQVNSSLRAATEKNKELRTSLAASEQRAQKLAEIVETRLSQAEDGEGDEDDDVNALSSSHSSLPVKASKSDEKSPASSPKNRPAPLKVGDSASDLRAVSVTKPLSPGKPVLPAPRDSSSEIAPLPAKAASRPSTPTGAAPANGTQKAKEQQKADEKGVPAAKSPKSAAADGADKAKEEPKAEEKKGNVPAQKSPKGVPVAVSAPATPSGEVEVTF